MPNPAPRRLGLLGGTFDPPHLGHLTAAEAVLSQLGLDQVSLVVANDPWQKSGDRSVTPASIRLTMAQALVEGISGLAADDREIRRGGPTYTADTLEEIRQEQPETEIFLILGADTAGRLPSWHRPEVVRALSTLVIVNRNGQTSNSRTGSDVHVFMDPVDASSTDIREHVARGESISHLTTNGVIRIIEEHGLYRSAS